MPNQEQIDYILKALGVSLSEGQSPVIYLPNREILVAGGERAGKSFLSSVFLTTRLPYGKLYWLVAADYGRTQAEFVYIQEFLAKMGWGFDATKRVDPGEINVAGGFRIVTKSAQDPRKLAMEAPDGVVVCESSQVDYETYLRIRGRIAEKRGWMLMSGCLSGDTYVFTSNGLDTIGRLVGNIAHPINLECSDGKATLAWYNGATATKKVSLSKGFSIEGTFDHKVVAIHSGKPGWHELKSLTKEDYVAVRYGMNLWGTADYDKNLCYISGLYLADGNCTTVENSHRFSIASVDSETGELLKSRGYVYNERSQQWRHTDKALAKFMSEIGLDISWKAPSKEIPNGILHANKESVVAFLRGLFDGDGSVAKDGRVVLSSISHKLLVQVQMLLLNLGIVSSLDTRGTDLYVSDCRLFGELVGFSLTRKQNRILLQPINKHRHPSNLGCIWDKFNGQPICWMRVKDITEGFCQSYDLHVPETHMYVANGIWVHNTFESSLGWY
jgi:hypothetical protein